MREYTIAEVKSICEAAALPLGVPFIDERLDEYKVKYSGAYPYYAALRDLARELKPRVVVEIGTWEGTSAAAFAAGNPDGAVITIDHHSDPGDDKNFAKMEEAVKAYPNIGYFQGCSTEMVHALKPGTEWVFPRIEKFLNGIPIDFLFIDGWHGGDFARADFDTFRPLLAPDALVICDDIYGNNEVTIFDMVKFWKGLPGEKYLDPRIHSVYQMGFAKMIPEAT